MNIDEARKDIDELDGQLVELLARRLKLAQDIGMIKKDSGRPVTDQMREEEVLSRISEMSARQGLHPDQLESIYRQIIASSKNMQAQRVGFQGEFGAYSHEATLQLFGDRVEAHPFESLEEVFKAVEHGEVVFAVVPAENSLEGSIGLTYDLLLDSNVKVCGERELRISHCLIANTQTRLEDVKRVYSHPQALGQCRAFFKHRTIEVIPAYDTAGSVKMIRDKALPDAAAIASERAAVFYEMRILLRNLEDNAYNFTRFFIIGKHDCAPTGNDKTSMVFSVKHQPGALFGFLGELAKTGINLTKIESRPTRRRAWDYNFYLDFEGHRLDPSFREALSRLEQYASFIKVLGSYPRTVSATGGEHR